MNSLFSHPGGRFQHAERVWSHFGLIGIAGTLVLMLTSCATTNTDWPWPQSKTGGAGLTCLKSECSEQDAIATLIQAQSFCRDIHNYYERGDKKTSRLRVASLAMGALAGSAAAQIANGSAAKAWAGLSGATNALNSGLSQEFSPLLAANRRQAVTQAIDAGIEAYRTSNSNSDRIIAAINMAAQCAVAPGRADGKSMQAIVESSK